ncbi:MAG: hypothetical protein GXO48_07070 [Chlorobi bacterium]|nr:hypothetical protein [Chlorobiota bacterium]
MRNKGVIRHFLMVIGTIVLLGSGKMLAQPIPETIQTIIKTDVIYLDSIGLSDTPLVITLDLPNSHQQKPIEKSTGYLFFEYEQWRRGVIYYDNIEIQIDSLEIKWGPDISNKQIFSTHQPVIRIAYPDTPGVKVELPQAQWIEVTVRSCCYQAPIVMWTEIHVQTKEDFFSLTGVTPNGLSTSTDGHNITFEWNNIPGADGYEIEWVYVPKYNERGQQVPLSMNAFSFKEKAVRHRTKYNYLTIPIIYREGFLVFRVRGFINRDGYVEYSEWSLEEQYDPACRCMQQNMLNLLSYPGLFNITSNIAQSENISYVGVMMGDGAGRQGFGIEYYDEWLRKTQTQSWLIYDSAILLNNYYYDHLGRQSIATLPWTEPGADLRYKGEKNFLPNGNVLHWREWEVAGNNGQAVVLDSTSGASKFYSKNNPYANRRLERNIPGAKGYPYSQTVFYPDGRPRLTGGHGPYHIGSGKETRYMYSNVFERKLYALFGTDVFDPSFYERLYVKDPNGQWAVQYLTLDGKKVAEALISSIPDSVEMIEGDLLYDAGYITKTQQGPKPKDAGGDLALPLPALVVNNYKFVPGEYKIVCGNDTLCLPCVYDVSIKATNVDLYTSPINQHWIISSDSLDLIMFRDSSRWDSGQYVFNRSVEWHEKIIDNFYDTIVQFYWENCINKSTVGTDTTGCNDCILCPGNMHDVDFCSSKMQQMLTHLTPGGQYMRYAIDSSGNVILPTNAHFSLLTGQMADNMCNDPDLLNAFMSNYPVNISGGYMSFRTPLYWNGSKWLPHYLKDDGTIDTLWLGIDVDTTEIYLPTYIMSIPGTNKAYTFPQYLTIDAFIQKFKPAWAHSLLPFHPEWCYLKECLKLREKKGYNNISMFSYGDSLRNMGVNVALSNNWLCNLENRDPVLQHLNVNVNGGSAYFPLGCSGSFNPASYIAYKINNYLYDSTNHKWLSIYHVAQISGGSNACDTAFLKYVMSLSPAALCSNPSLWNDSTWTHLISIYNSLREQVIMGYLHSVAFANGNFNGCIGQDYNQNNINSLFCNNSIPSNQQICSNSMWQLVWSDNSYSVAFGNMGQVTGNLYMTDSIVTIDELLQMQQWAGNLSGVCPGLMLMYSLIYMANDYGLENNYVFRYCNMSGIKIQWGLDSLWWNSKRYSDSLVVSDPAIGRWLVLYIPSHVNLDSVVYLSGIGDVVPTNNGWLFELHLTMSDYTVVPVRAWTSFNVEDCGDVCGVSLPVQSFIEWFQGVVAKNGDLPNGDTVPLAQLPPYLVLDANANYAVINPNSIVFEPSGARWTWSIQTSSPIPSPLAYISFKNCDCGTNKMNVELFDTFGNSYPATIHIIAYSSSNEVLYESECGDWCVGQATQLRQQLVQWLDAMDDKILIGGTVDVSDLGLLAGYIKNGVYDTISIESEEPNGFTVYGHASSNLWTCNFNASTTNSSSAMKTAGGGTHSLNNSSISNRKVLLLKTSKIKNKIILKGSGPAKIKKKGGCEAWNNDPNNTCDAPGDTDCLYDCDNDGICDCGHDPTCSGLINSLITVKDSQLLSLEYNASSYQWAFCNGSNVTPIAGAIHQTFVPPQSGWYTVIITKGGCVDTASCSFIQLSDDSTYSGCDVSATPIVIQGDTLIAPVYTGATYQWYMCLDDGSKLPVPGANSNVFVMPDVGGTGFYAVQIASQYCSEMSDCVGNNNINNNNNNNCTGLQVTVEKDPITGQLIADVSGATQYQVQWFKCIGQTKVPVYGATTPNFPPPTHGYYAVIVSSPVGCVDTSACFYVVPSGGGGLQSCNCEITVMGVSESLMIASNVEFVELIASNGQFVDVVYKGQLGTKIIYDTVVIELCFEVEPTCCEPDTALGSIACGWELPIIPPMPIDSTDYCVLAEEGIVYIANQIDSLFRNDSIISEFVSAYTSSCRDGWRDEWYVENRLGEYNFTLYYYDRAGNLVKVVPADGVEPLDSATVDQIMQNPNLDITPQHRKAVRYRYTDENAVWARYHPDRGWDRTWYDFAGRPFLSQDERQRQEGKASYVVFDDQSRPIESGVAHIRNPFKDSIYLLASLSSYLQVDSTLYDRIVTVYDTPSTYLNLDNLHNRSRVTASLRWEYFSGCDTTYKKIPVWKPPVGNTGDMGNIPTEKKANDYGAQGKTGYPYSVNNKTIKGTNEYKTVINKITCPTPDYGIFYNYDAIGKVMKEVHWIPELSDYEKEYFEIEYEYEPATGRIEQMVYQRGKPDEFRHKYVYDDYGRLEYTLTSRDGFNWYREARNEYNIIGQVARLSIGDEKFLQGLDFISTIQGWLKAINSENISIDNDPGADGKENDLHEHFARDVFGMVLRYHHNDYYSVGNATQFTGTINSGENWLHKPYYTGWIASWSMTMDTLHTAYSFTYDQLGRVTKARTLTGWDASNNSWNATITPVYSTSYKYDAIGNIKELIRFDANGTKIDHLKYHYYDLLNNNKLNYIEDLAGQTPMATDLETQSPQNYIYDPVGNMLEDKSRSIELSYNYSNRPIYVAENKPSAIHKRLYMAYNPLGYRYVKGKHSGHTEANKPDYYRDISSKIKDAQYFIYSSSGQLIAIYLKENDTLRLEALPIYHGAKRIGVLKPHPTPLFKLKKPTDAWVIEYDPFEQLLSEDLQNKPRIHALLPQRYYELTDHLGNIRVVISNLRIAEDTDNDGITDHYKPHIQSIADYYPFGWEKLPLSNNYPFAYQGQIHDPEWNSIYYRFRNYDPQTIRFFQVEPLIDKYPGWTTYAFAHNKVPYATELEGLEADTPEVTLDEVLITATQSGYTYVEVNNEHKLRDVLTSTSYGMGNFSGLTKEDGNIYAVFSSRPEVTILDKKPQQIKKLNDKVVVITGFVSGKINSAELFINFGQALSGRGYAGAGLYIRMQNLEGRAYFSSAVYVEGANIEIMKWGSVIDINTREFLIDAGLLSEVGASGFGSARGHLSLVNSNRSIGYDASFTLKPSKRGSSGVSLSDKKKFELFYEIGNWRWSIISENNGDVMFRRSLRGVFQIRQQATPSAYVGLVGVGSVTVDVNVREVDGEEYNKILEKQYIDQIIRYYRELRNQ